MDVTFNAIATSEGYQQLISGELFPESGDANRPQLNPAQQINHYYTRLDQKLSDALGAISSAHGERARFQTVLQTTPVSGAAGNGDRHGAAECPSAVR